MRVFRRNVTRGLMAFSGAYCAIYLVLTLQGRYEPAAWGLHGPKWYQWAPWGFVREMRWRETLVLVFLPLWEADRFLWHTSELAYSGRYPANLIGDDASSEPDGPASGTQSIRSETNQSPSAAASRR